MRNGGDSSHAAMDMEEELEWDNDPIEWHEIVARWMKQYGYDKALAVALASQAGDAYEVPREAFRSLLQVEVKALRFSALQGITMTAQAMQLNPAYDPLQPPVGNNVVMVSRDRIIPALILRGADEQWSVFVAYCSYDVHFYH